MKSAAIVFPAVSMMLLFFCAPSLADDASAMDNINKIVAGQCEVDGKPVSRSALDVAVDVVKLTDESGNSEPMSLTVVEQSLALSEQLRNPASKLDPQTGFQFRIAIEQELKQDLPKILEAEGCIYAQYYSFDELRQLRAFYSSPVGRKFISADIPIYTATVELGRVLANSPSSIAALDRAKKKLRAQGAKL